MDVCVGEGQSLGNRLDFGGPSFGFFAADRALHPQDAGPDRGRDARRGRPARLRAHAPDARAAHPPREGHAQHLHRPGAERAGGRRLPVLARQARARGARRADAAPHALRARGARARGDQPGAGGARVRRARAGPRRACSSAPARRASTRATGSAATTRSFRTGCSSPSQNGAPRSTSTGWPSSSGAPGARGGRRMSDDTLTVFERSRAGRRAFTAPDTDVPEVPVEELLPADAIRERPAELPEISEPELVRHYTTLSSKNFHLDEGFYPLGSCTMKHNPKLHERVAALPGHARLHPLQDPEYAQGALELMWRLQGALGEIAGLPHVSLQPSAGSHGELAGPAAHARLPRGPRRAAHEGAHAGHRPRHEPGDRDDGGLRGGEGGDGAGRRGGPRRPAREGRRRRGLPDAHEPEHARAVRPQHRGDRPDRARRRRDALLRRREPERRDGHRPARRHGLRHRPLQPAQDLHAAARRRRPGRGPDRVLGPDRAVPAGAAGGGARRALRPRLRPAQVDRQAARLPGQLRRVRALLRVHLLARAPTG